MRPGDPRRKAGFGGRLRPPFRGGPDYLLNYADGTFARASAATWPLLPTSIEEYASGTARILSPDGEYVSEGARTNDVDGDSSRIDSTAWTLAASATVASEDVTSLFSGESADTLSFAAGVDSGNHTDILGSADGETYTVSVIAWTASGTKAFRLRVVHRDGTATESDDLTATTDAQLFTYTVGLGTGATQPELRIVNEAGGGTGTIAIDHVQAEAAEFASSPIRSTDGVAATRVADGLALAVGQYDARILNSPWEVVVVPEFSSDDITGGSSRWRIISGTSADHMDFIGGSTPRFEFRSGGAQGLINATWDAFDPLTLRMDPLTGDASLSGALTGDGSVSWVGGAWGANTLIMGYVTTPGSNAFYGTISRPIAVDAV